MEEFKLEFIQKTYKDREEKEGRNKGKENSGKVRNLLKCRNMRFSKSTCGCILTIISFSGV